MPTTVSPRDKQTRRDVRADEPGASSDEDLHASAQSRAVVHCFGNRCFDVEDHALRFAELADCVDAHFAELIMCDGDDDRVVVVLR